MTPYVNTARPRVLVADPDPESAALLARSLEWSGYDVTTVFNGRDALDVIARTRPAAVVLELKMDVLNGYQVIRKMREDLRNRKTPVIVISARAGKLDRDFAFTVGADDYVKKPFLSSELVARVAMLLPAQVEAAPAAASPISRPRRSLAPARALTAH